jgi:radical SAM protein with 4Fe4S-binding SPASM domain
MCETWQAPTDRNLEIRAEHIAKLPYANFVNVTGGEPFLRDDLEEVISVLKPRTKRLVVSTNGLLTERITSLMKKHPDIGIRISLDGFAESHDRVRGVRGAFDKALLTLTELQMLKIKDLGIGMTLSDTNYHDLKQVFTYAESTGLEFPINIVHNSYYFHKMDNEIRHQTEIEKQLRWAIGRYLRSRVPKNWFRAYFTDGIIDYIYGRPRRLQCEAGVDMFLLDPTGDIYPCNMLAIKMGNIKNQTFDEAWQSPESKIARERVCRCNENCWMIGSAAGPMRKKIWKPLWWIVRNKLFRRDSRNSQCD